MGIFRRPWELQRPSLGTCIQSMGAFITDESKRLCVDQASAYSAGCFPWQRSHASIGMGPAVGRLDPAQHAPDCLCSRLRIEKLMAVQ